MLTLGIDDAGRGPVVGPMIIGGCLIDEKLEDEFKKLGVKDSKQLTDKRREFLADIVRQKAIAFDFVVITAEEIDSCNAAGVNLNQLEAIKMAEIINRVNKGFTKMKVVVDCPSVSIAPWRDYLKTKINELHNLDVVCEHKADVNHVSVSAASIIAKSTREKEMAKIREKYPEVGSGYTSDPLTQRFLEKNAKKFEEAGIFRKSWETWKTCITKLGQRTLE